MKFLEIGRQQDRKEKDMYVKIVRHLENEQGVSSSRGSLEAKVVPSEHHIFECWEARYRKVAVNNISEFNERMKYIESVRIVISVPEEGPFEFIQVQMFMKEDDLKYAGETLIARDCMLYLMNNEGKTIDSIVCR